VTGTNTGDQTATVSFLYVTTKYCDIALLGVASGTHTITHIIDSTDSSGEQHTVKNFFWRDESWCQETYVISWVGTFGVFSGTLPTTYDSTYWIW
jgi:hypothetical protein